MKKVISLICVLFSIFSNSQSFNPKILTLPENPTTNDFSFLKDELKNVQVVMLGEKTHFDGNVFEMKSKMIKYLHQEMDFNTVAFESGVYDVWKAQKMIEKGEKTKIAIEKSLFSIWSKTKEFQSFITYFDQNKNTIKLFGFDNQVTGEYGEKNLFIDLFEYCKENNLPLKLKREDLELLIESMFISGVFDDGDISYEDYKTTFTNLLNKIDKKPKNEPNFYWKQIIKNLISLGEDFHSEKELIFSTFYTNYTDNNRDKQMAENLLEYIKEHPNEKIICWGANQHFVNNMSSVKTPIIKEYKPMGEYIKTILKDKVYSLAVVTAMDSVFLDDKWNSTPIKEISFEYFLKSKKSKLIFISSNQNEMKKNISNRLFSPITFIESRIDLIHDGYLYFDNVTPSNSISLDDNIEIKSIVKEISKVTKTEKNTIKLDEILIYSKKHPYKILTKAIENIEANYPINPFNSKLYSKIEFYIQNEQCSAFDFISNQYDRGYSQVYRCSEKIDEIRWIDKKCYNPKSFRSISSLSSNNPIMYGTFINKRKLKKFALNIDEVKMYNDNKAYVISFSTIKDHFNYTNRLFFSNYSGKLYVNENDYAIVKIIENWEVKNYNDLLQQVHEVAGLEKKYVKKEISNETIETNYQKVDNLLFFK